MTQLKKLCLLIPMLAGMLWVLHPIQFTEAQAASTAHIVIGGSAAGSIAESEIVAGGQTLKLIIISSPGKVNDVIWHTSIGGNNAQTTALINGFSGGACWGGIGLTFSNVTRNSDSETTVTLPANAGCAIGADETVTLTVPAASLTGSGGLDFDPRSFWIVNGSVTTLNQAAIDADKVYDSGIYLINSAITLNAASLIFEGTSVLRLRAGANIFFQNVVEASMVGSGDPVDSAAVLASFPNDYGLWILGNARLDAQGTSKVSWNRVGDDASWLGGDTLVSAPIAVGDYTGFNEAFVKGAAPPTYTGSDGVTRTTEIINLTRDVVIRGADGARSHIFFNGNRWQYLDSVEIRFMGPGISTQQLPKGRYPLHFHKMDDGSYGSYLKDVSVHHTRANCFVPHTSHGITFYRTACYFFSLQGYWWDPGDQTHHVRWDNTLAARTDLTGFSETNSGFTFFLVGSGTNLTNSCMSCVAVGSNSNSGVTQNSGYHWPERSNALPNVWFFVDSTAHNIRKFGLSVWQNTTTNPHDIENFVAFNIGSSGIDHGAYGTPGYHYHTTPVTGASAFTLVDIGFGITQHAQSVGVTRDDGYGLSFENGRIYGTGYSLFLEAHNLASPAIPALYLDVSLGASTGGKRILIDENVPNFEKVGLYDLVYSPGFTGTEIGTADPCAEIQRTYIVNGSTMRIQNTGGSPSAVSVDLTTCAVTGIADFYDFAAPPEVPPEGPSAPQNVTAVAGIRQATISYTTPATAGSSAIIDYTIIAALTGGGQTTFPPVVTTGLSAVFPNLVAGTSYVFSVTARNTEQMGDVGGPSNSVLPISIDLSSLNTSHGSITLTPPTTTYSIGLAHGTTSITVTPTTEDPFATLTVNNQAATSGQPFAVNNLIQGTNPILIKVTRNPEQEYVLNAVVSASNITQEQQGVITVGVAAVAVLGVIATLFAIQAGGIAAAGPVIIGFAIAIIILIVALGSL